MIGYPGEGAGHRRRGKRASAYSQNKKWGGVRKRSLIWQYTRPRPSQCPSVRGSVRGHASWAGAALRESRCIFSSPPPPAYSSSSLCQTSDACRVRNVVGGGGGCWRWWWGVRGTVGGRRRKVPKGLRLKSSFWDRHSPLVFSRDACSINSPSEENGEGWGFGWGGDEKVEGGSSYEVVHFRLF